MDQLFGLQHRRRTDPVILFVFSYLVSNVAYDYPKVTKKQGEPRGLGNQKYVSTAKRNAGSSRSAI